MNFYNWVIENITDFFYKKRTKVYIKEEELETNTETNKDTTNFQYFIGRKRKEHIVWWRKNLLSVKPIITNDKTWNNQEHMNNYIIKLTNYYKNNNSLYRITTQIRNFVTLNNDDINIIMKFEKNELLTIVLLQNYCFQYYKNYIDENVRP